MGLLGQNIAAIRMEVLTSVVIYVRCSAFLKVDDSALDKLEGLIKIYNEVKELTEDMEKERTQDTFSVAAKFNGTNMHICSEKPPKGNKKGFA